MRYTFVLLLLSALLLAGCGQKGPLFLPGHPPEDYTDQPAGANQNGSANKPANAEPGRQVPDLENL